MVNGTVFLQLLGFVWSSHQSSDGVADSKDDFERETEGFTFKISPLLSNASIFKLTEMLLEKAFNSPDDCKLADRPMATHLSQAPAWLPKP